MDSINPVSIDDVFVFFLGGEDILKLEL